MIEYDLSMEPCLFSTLAYDPRYDVAMGFVVIGVGVALITWILITAVRGPRNPRNDLAQLYERASERYDVLCAAEPWPDEPTIHFVFHTYSGTVLGFWQTEHALALPLRHAVILGNEFHSYNLRGCRVPYRGVFFVPLLSWLSLRKVRRLAAAQGLPKP